LILEELVKLDKQFFVFLNALGSVPYDQFWSIITKQIYWTPFFIGIFYLVQKKIGWKNFGVLILFLALLLTFTDQITNLFKNGFQRLRPCNDKEIRDIIRVVIHRDSFSFFSGHASNSMASTLFFFLIIRKYYKHTYLLFLFPIIFAYSRIYLGLHFPLDIISGYAFGLLTGFFFYKSYLFFIKRYMTN
jgi:undecaprenyl-diphosphatase